MQRIGIGLLVIMALCAAPLRAQPQYQDVLLLRKASGAGKNCKAGRVLAVIFDGSVLKKSDDCSTWADIGVSLSAANTWTVDQTFSGYIKTGSGSAAGIKPQNPSQSIKIVSGSTASIGLQVLNALQDTTLFSVRTNGTVSAPGTLQAGQLFADLYGSHIVTTGSTPTLTAGCGTGATIAGNDGDGRVTWGSGGGIGCQITFNAAWTTAPVCFARSTNNVMLLFTGAATTTLMSWNVKDATSPVDALAPTAGDIFVYQCRGF